MAENIEEIKESRQYIVVNLKDEHYGIDIQYVDNIVRMQRITRVPKAQKYYKGVINLRGEIIPVMSLRLKFDLEDDVFGSETRILIIKPESQGLVGIIVDEVKEVLSIDSDLIEKVAYDGNEEKASYIFGVGKLENMLVSLLNIEGVINEKEKEKE